VSNFAAIYDFVMDNERKNSRVARWRGKVKILGEVLR